MIPSDKELIIKGLKRMISDNHDRLVHNLKKWIELECSIFEIKECLDSEMPYHIKLCEKLIELEKEEK